MKRFVVVPLLSMLVVTAASCVERHDLFISWTIDGDEAAAGCEAFSKPVLEANVVQKNASTDPDARTDPGVVERVELACNDGEGTLSIAPFAAVSLDLLSGGDVFGVSSKVEVSAGSNAIYTGDAADNRLPLNVKIVQGTLQARLTVVGEDCGDAGVDTFSVTLLHNTAPLQDDPVIEDQEVSCEDGVALFSYAPVQVGDIYKVAATASGFVTDGNGEGTVVEGAQTTVVVDLRAE